MFAAFAFGYFLSALVRAVTATLAPVFSAELGLGAAQLGLLAGAYFLGFAAMQLPLGSALDHWGARRVLLVLLAVAALGCALFARSDTLAQLGLARLLIGVGVAACLMAPLTCFRHLLSAADQLRANAWMLMTGSLGMLASTLPVQWLLPVIGWRGLFLLVAALLLVAAALVAAFTPGQAHGAPADALNVGEAPGSAPAAGGGQGYRTVFSHPGFVRLAPLGFFAYGGMVAMQSLWIGPWLTQVGGVGAQAAAGGLFIVNLAMLLAFLCWGLLMPRLVRAGFAGERLIAMSWPASVLCLAVIVWQGAGAPGWSWALWCVLSSVVSLSQPAVGQAFAPALAGRALSAFNLVIFSGVFTLQWCIGLAIDRLEAVGLDRVDAFRAAFAGFGLCCTLAFLWLNLLRWRMGRAQALLHR